MRNDSSSDVAASEAEAEAEDERSITAVADVPAVTRERAPEVQPGDVLAGRYQIEAAIGKGGSGVVMRAFDRVSATVVALKILKPGLTHDPRWEKRFQRELRLGRPIRHPNVCRIFDIGDADGYRFLTMEFATGGTLRDLIKKNQPLRPLADRLVDAASVIAGLTAIHGAGIVHRDVKPDNMLRMEDGRLVLSDFGLATDLPDSTMVSVFVGTPHYMAPEVREGDPATTRSDVWSLGVVLHEIFTGRRPERRNSRSGASYGRGQTTKSSSMIDRAMLALCERCLAEDPAERPADANAVQRLFESARRSPYALLKTSRRRLVAAAVAAIAACTGAVAIGVRTNRRSAAVSERSHTAVPSLSLSGQAADWSGLARTIASIPGHTYCFSFIDDRSVRLIWGNPRRAEDVDISTGTRRASPLEPATYSVGCPDVSPDHREILFTVPTPVGGTEIRHSAHLDGKDARTVTAGSDPVWLMSGEEFAYSVDASHAAVFSLPTMKYRLLADAAAGHAPALLGKAASAHSEAVALAFFTSDWQWMVTIYEGLGLAQKTTAATTGPRNIRFDRMSDRLFVFPREDHSAVAAFDWRHGRLAKIGRIGDVELIDMLTGGDRALLLGQKRASDVWLYEGSSKRRLTDDGRNVSAAISREGTLLLSKPDVSGALNIWSRKRDGSVRKLTNGQLDTTPNFSPDGSTWAYADYPRKSIVICSTETAVCRVFRKEDLLLAWPRFSPDGTKIAYIRQSPVPRLIVMSVADGREWSVGDTHWQCPPVWSSPNEVWAFEGSAGHYAWTERNLEKRARTGRRVEVSEGRSAVEDELDCWPRGIAPTSPFFEKLRVETEETTSILGVPRSVLAD